MCVWFFWGGGAYIILYTQTFHGSCCRQFPFCPRRIFYIVVASSPTVQFVFVAWSLCKDDGIYVFDVMVRCHPTVCLSVRLLTMERRCKQVSIVSVHHHCFVEYLAFSFSLCSFVQYAIQCYQPKASFYKIFQVDY